jgi:hypothetical protein
MENFFFIGEVLTSLCGTLFSFYTTLFLVPPKKALDEISMSLMGEEPLFCLWILIPNLVVMWGTHFLHVYMAVPIFYHSDNATPKITTILIIIGIGLSVKRYLKFLKLQETRRRKEEADRIAHPWPTRLC